MVKELLNSLQEISFISLGSLAKNFTSIHMVSVTRYRSHEFEVIEADFFSNRSRVIQLTLLLTIVEIFLSIFVIINLTNLLFLAFFTDLVIFDLGFSLLWLFVFLPILLLVEYCRHLLKNISKQELLIGNKFLFSDRGKLQTWKSMRLVADESSLFTEEEVRFTQAIGFRIVLVYNQLIHLPNYLDRSIFRYLIHKFKSPEGELYFSHFGINIIYDEIIAGIEIFRSKSAISVVEMLKIFETILPTHSTLEYVMLEDMGEGKLKKADEYSDIPSEEKALFDELMDEILLPSEFREYFREMN